MNTEDDTDRLRDRIRELMGVRSFILVMDDTPLDMVGSDEGSLEMISDGHSSVFTHIGMLECGLAALEGEVEAV